MKLILLLCLLAAFPTAGAAAVRVVVYDNVATEVAPAPGEIAASEDLWVTRADLKRATGFVVKPQGVCRDELCFPIPKARKAAVFARHAGVEWFNLSEFARLVKQPAAFDAEQSVWYFGPRADEQNGHIASLRAPDFTLPDKTGRMHSLRDYRGKKVLLVTWASW
jgi:AhpC/TSA family